MNENEFEDAFRAMFAERSEDVRVTTSPYRAVRKRMAAARRRRRQRLGGVGAALAVAAVGIGVWGTVSGGPRSAGPTTPGPTSGSAATVSATTISRASGPPRFVFDDGKTGLPAGSLRDAAEAYVKAKYHGDLSGLTVVTTFNQAMQQAAGSSKSPNDIGLAALDPRTGYVKALRGTWDRPVEIADLIKPITLAAAFETGHYTPDSLEPLSTDKHPIYWPPGSREPLTYMDSETHQKRNWPPEHGSGQIWSDSSVTLREATVDAANAPFAALELSADVTPGKVLAMALQLGVPSDSPDLQPVLSLTLGTAQVSPLTMAAVYGVFADGGVRHDPVLVAAVRDAKGATVWEPDITGVQALSQNTANQITDILRGVLTSGTAAGDADARALGARGSAGSSGTGDFDRTAWFDGYSPDLVTAVALSHLDANGRATALVRGSSGQTVYGGPVVGPMWAAFMKQFEH